MFAQSLDQGDISRLVSELGLNVEIESVHYIVSEWAGTRPVGVDRSIGAPQEVGEVLAILDGRHRVAKSPDVSTFILSFVGWGKTDLFWALKLPPIESNTFFPLAWQLAIPEVM
jgi:hypothetical protein